MIYFVFLHPKSIKRNKTLSSTNIEPDYNLDYLYVFQAFQNLCWLHNGRLYTFNSFINNPSKSFVFLCSQKRQIFTIININCQIFRYFLVVFNKNVKLFQQRKSIRHSILCFLWQHVYLPGLPDWREEWEGSEWLRRKYYCTNQQY